MREISTFTDKDSLIKHLTSLAISGDYVFRGYSIQSQMLPSILRKKVVDLEKELLIDFERYGSQYISISNPIDLMSYAQHFGIPTRLLDFTFNPFIALYFALFKEKPNNATHPDDKVFYYLICLNIRENDYLQELGIPSQYGQMMGTISNSWAQKAINCIRKVEMDYKDSSGRILIIDPNQSNQRLVMQQGLFMFPYTLDEKEHELIVNNNTHCIRVHKNLRIELQDFLNTIGINAFRLMPDLASVCEAVERSVKERKKRRGKSAFTKQEELTHD